MCYNIINYCDLEFTSISTNLGDPGSNPSCAFVCYTVSTSYISKLERKKSIGLLSRGICVLSGQLHSLGFWSTGMVYSKESQGFPLACQT